MPGGFSLEFEPLIPETLLIVLGGAALAVVLYALIRRARAAPLRLILMLALIGALAGPTLVEEERRYYEDIAVVVVDRSTSQGIGERTAQTDRALRGLIEELEASRNLEVRLVEAGPRAGGPTDGTYLMEAINRALEGVPRDRVAGIVALTDGQAHDLPDTVEKARLPAPLHVLLTGRPGERDRRIEVVSAPAFSIVGQGAEARVVVHDEAASGDLARIELRRDGETIETRVVPVGVETRMPLPVEHGGRNLFELIAEPGVAELTLENNRTALSVNGVRDRLRVLLVSGEPYPGERAWRNLLKADPAVDLVHFTILRPPQKQDSTPIHELALIAFPIRELFELKLQDFDLIIFDRFWRRGVLHFSYLRNIADYVHSGGALLDAAGPAFAGPASIYRTPLADVLPSAPTGNVTVRGFRPAVTELGSRHPVTARLEPTEDEQPWGRWFRLIDTEPQAANTLMAGPEQKPLLVLDRVGEGRVAQVLSDQGWLWARGFEGGGPQDEIMRRLAHWLMKEPALEEESLSAEIEERTLTVRRQSLRPEHPPVRVTGPDGRTETLRLGESEHGVAVARTELDVAGLYRISDGSRETVAVLGSLNPKEFANLVSTDAKLRPFVQATGGGIIRLSDEAEPGVRRVAPDRRAAGSDWVGMVENEAFDITGLKRTPLMPPLAVLLVLMAFLLLAWRREGR